MHGADWNAAIERCQLSAVPGGECEQVHIGYMRIGDERIGFEDIADGKVINP